jgi:hypothetical protein
VGAAGVLNLELADLAFADGTELSAARKATYAALFSALRDANGISTQTNEVTDAVTQFATDYSAEGPAVRAYIDSVLDGIEGSEPGGYSQAAPSEQVQTLHAWRNAPCFPDDPGVTETTCQQRRTAAAAIDIATCPSILTVDYKIDPLPV